MKKLILVLPIIIAMHVKAQEIALTFDDAPTEDGPFYSGEQRSRNIIKHLREQKVEQAAFFVITKNIADNNGLGRLESYVKAGHILANHTHKHRWIHDIGVVEYIEDIAKADSILRSIPGYKPWFRYPFLDEGRTKPARDSIRAALANLGLTNGYVTVDNYDWYLNGQAREAIQNKKHIDEAALRELYIEHIWSSILFYDAVARKNLGRSPKHVLLLHENDLTAKFLGDLIEHIKQQGWRIISPSEAYTDAIANELPDVLFNGQGRVAAIAREHGTSARELVQESEDERYLDKQLAERKIFR